jgi:cell division inhibitor SepF
LVVFWMETPFGVWLPQVTILRSRRLSEAQDAVEAIRARHCVLLQLDDAAPEEGQRIIDFLAGAVSALDGQVERIGEGTFLFAPVGVTVSHS